MLAFPLAGIGQNLVPNPSFEDYNTCPIGPSCVEYSPTYSSFNYVKDWVKPVQFTDPDYMNTCAALSSGVQVPEVMFGHQWPRTGNAYAGIIAWQGVYKNGNLIDDYREYLQCKLLQPMIAGRTYCVSFYVSPTIAQKIAYNYVWLDEIGMNFSNTQVSKPAGHNLSLPYSVQNAPGNFLTDSANWIRISTTYLAQGGEQWLTLGCFNNTSSIPLFQQAYPATVDPTLNYRSYMYFDDLGVYLINSVDTSYNTFDSFYCLKSAIPMELNSSGNDGTFLWNTGATTKKITVNADGTYWCIAKADCHTSVDTFIVKYQPDKKMNLGGELFNCQEQPVTITPPYSYNKYNWSTGEKTPNITVSKSGTYWLTASNQCGTQTDTVKVYIQPPTAPPVASDTIICQLKEDAKIHVNGVNLLWYNTAEGIVGSPVQPQIITRDLGRITIYVTQTIGKCESDKVPINIDIKYQPRKVLPNLIDMCATNVLTMGTDVSIDVTYRWSTGEGLCCIKPDHEGFFLRQVSSKYCGTYIDSTNVTFSPCDECLQIPNAFSPNHDGKNDKFVVMATCPIEKFHISIYNRWGQKIFQTDDINESWDGGETTDNGAYVYVIEYRSASTKRDQMIKGSISLLK